MKKLFFFLIFSSSLLITSSAIAHPGIGIVMDSKGNVYFTDLEHVWKISKNGKLSIAVKNVHTHELYIDEEDNIYGEHSWYEGETTDKWGYYLWCLNDAGVFQQNTPHIEGFVANNKLIRDSKSNTYWQEKVNNHDIINKTKSNGDTIIFSDHKFEDIRWMYYSKDDNYLYVIDMLSLKKVNSKGKVSLVSSQLKESKKAHASVGDHHYLMGIWTDSKLNVYVAAFGEREVKKIDVEGKQQTIIKSSLLWSPSGGLIADDGSLWLLEYSRTNKARVRQIKTNGEEVVYKS